MKRAPTTSPFDVLDARFVAEARDALALPPATLPEIAFAGRSNVGKSTLLNALAQRRHLARTSRTPGCTRGVIVFDLALRSGQKLRLVDLPGYGFADRAKSERRSWGPLIEGYLRGRESLRGVMLLVDSRRGPEEEERDLVGFLSAAGVPHFMVATKVDKLTRAERGPALARIAGLAGVRVLGVSGESGEGREELVRLMSRLVGDDAPTSGV
jgi:GTP-binding protein